MSEQKLNKIKEFFKNDTYAMNSGFEIVSAENGESVCRCVTDKAKHMNAVGHVMGGVYFALGDFAFAVAVNSEAALGTVDKVTVAVDNSIQFFRGVSDGVLTARAVPLKRGRSMNFYRVDITDSDGNLAASMTCTGTVTQK